MKTNASIKTIVAAVEKVSKEKYDGNLILSRNPEILTKNVNRFTLRTRDKFKSPSIMNKDKKPLPRAKWETHMEVINEIFNIEGKRNIYVDTDYGRQFSDKDHAEATVVAEARSKRPYNKVKPISKKQDAKTAVVKHATGDQISISKLIAALQQVLVAEKA